MTSRFHNSLQTYSKKVGDDPNIIGLAVSGSLLTGLVGPYSDIDAYIVTAEPDTKTPAWCTHSVDGIEIEQTQMTQEEYRRIIAEGARVRDIVYPISKAGVILDHDGTTAGLIESAKRRISELSLSYSLDLEGKQSVYRATTFGYRKTGNAFYRNDPASFNYHIGFALHILPVHIASMSGKGICPDPLNYLRQDHPALFDLYSRTLLAPTVQEKWENYQNLISSVAVLFGFEMPQPVSLPNLDKRG